MSDKNDKMETDTELAEKFKREHSEQFQILVRMHLSFVLDLNTDESEYLSSDKNKFKKWGLVPFTKKIKCQKGVMDGAPLTQEGICQVYQLIEYLKKEQNLKVEGIFRRSGSLARQQELRNLLNEGVTVDLECSDYSIHDCATVLKGFLAELPDPLLTEAHYPAYCQIAESCGIIDNETKEEKLLTALQLILLLLPSDNKVLLKDILELLNLTTSYESSNRMSADNLAKLFTPHLLCPRKLSPEQLHINSQNLYGIVAFMINKSKELFKIPQKLMMDFRAKYVKNTQLNLNDSVNELAANTVFTFLDKEKTAKENEFNTTETALAQLYAHIQSLPESSKKRKLIKQFNKENGYGTPLQVIRSNMPKNKSLGDSIKKRILQKSLVRSVKNSLMKTMSEEDCGTPKQENTSKTDLIFCTRCDASTNSISDEENDMKKFKLSENDNLSDKEQNINVDEKYLTSTPACKRLNNCFTPEDHNRKSMSPITRSTQKMSKAMQETMMTPRSRKPVLLVSGTNINALPALENKPIPMDNLAEDPEESDSQSDLQIKENKESSLSQHFKEYLSNRSIVTLSPTADLSFSSRTDDFISTELNDLSDTKMSDSLLKCLNGEQLDQSQDNEKEFVLKPKQFDENGHPIIFETSF